MLKTPTWPCPKVTGRVCQTPNTGFLPHPEKPSDPYSQKQLLCFSLTLSPCHRQVHSPRVPKSQTMFPARSQQWLTGTWHSGHLLNRLFSTHVSQTFLSDTEINTERGKLSYLPQVTCLVAMLRLGFPSLFLCATTR